MNVSWDQKGDVDRDYKVNDFGLDSDIKSSLSNLDLEQNLHGRWNLQGFPEPKAEQADEDAKVSESSVTVVEKE